MLDTFSQGVGEVLQEILFNACAGLFRGFVRNNESVYHAPVIDLFPEGVSTVLVRGAVT